MKVTATWDLRRRPVEALSGGQRQRVWLAMALAQETPVLLLDEPTSFLDMAHQIEMLELVRELNETEGKTVVMVLHDLCQACHYADYIVAMKEGGSWRRARRARSSRKRRFAKHLRHGLRRLSGPDHRHSARLALRSVGYGVARSCA